MESDSCTIGLSENVEVGYLSIIRRALMPTCGFLLGGCPYDVQRIQTNPEEYRTIIRELSGPRLLRWVAGNFSKPPIRNHNAGAISFVRNSARTADQVIGAGKDRNPACFRLIKRWRYRYASTFNFIELRYIEVRGYRGINLG